MEVTDQSKPKSSILKGKKLLIAIGTVLVLILLLFLFRGWVRMSVLPKTIDTFYSNSVEEVYKNELSKLQDPLGMLGYQEVGQLGLLPQGCNTVVANGIKTQVNCTYETSAYQEVDPDPETKKNLNANAEKLQALLQANDWQGEYSNEGEPYTSLVKLVSSITSDVDYQPDASYEKQVGDVRCYFQNYTSFSQPDPAAITTRISCSRTFNILGEPSWN